MSPYSPKEVNSRAKRPVLQYQHKILLHRKSNDFIGMVYFIYDFYSKYLRLVWKVGKNSENGSTLDITTRKVFETMRQYSNDVNYDFIDNQLHV